MFYKPRKDFSILGRLFYLGRIFSKNTFIEIFKIRSSQL